MIAFLRFSGVWGESNPSLEFPMTTAPVRWASRLHPARAAILVAFAACFVAGCGIADAPKSDTTKPVSGRVTLDGVPQAGRTVTLTRSDLTVTRATTNASGVYEAEVETGTYDLSVDAPDMNCPRQEDKQILTADSYTFDFECSPLRGSIEGTVIVDGAPAPGVAVQIRRVDSGATITVTTDPMGIYRSDLEVGDYAVAPSVPPAECEPDPGLATIAHDAVARLDFVCSTPFGFVTGVARLNGVPVPSANVTIYDANLLPVASAITDVAGVYEVQVPPGLHHAAVDIEGAICPFPSERPTVVPARGTAAVDLDCVGIEGLYDATLTETSNTCSTDPQPGFPVALTFLGTIPGGVWDFQLAPGDRPQPTWAELLCDPNTRMCSGPSPQFGDGSGFLFQEQWDLSLGFTGPGVPTLDLGGTVEVEITFPAGGTCTRFFGVTGSGGGG